MVVICLVFSQMVQNCRNLKGMVGISFWLMMQWFLGDATNLIGSVLSGQLRVQVQYHYLLVESGTVLVYPVPLSLGRVCYSVNLPRTLGIPLSLGRVWYSVSLPSTLGIPLSLGRVWYSVSLPSTLGIPLSLGRVWYSVSLPKTLSSTLISW